MGLGLLLSTTRTLNAYWFSFAGQQRVRARSVVSLHYLEGTYGISRLLFLHEVLILPSFVTHHVCLICRKIYFGTTK